MASLSGGMGGPTMGGVSGGMVNRQSYGAPQQNYGAPQQMGAPQPASARAPAAQNRQIMTGGLYDMFNKPPAQSASTQMQMPKYQPPAQQTPYQSYDPQSSGTAQDLQTLSQSGQDLMDPNSDYYKQLVSQARGDLGKGAAAQKRALALSGAEQGFGAGQSTAMMSGMENIDEANRIGMGNMMGDISLAAPQIGAGMMASTFGPGAQLQGMGEQSSQFGAGMQESGQLARAGMGENARQFGTNVGLQQQGMAQDRAQREAEMQTQQQQWEAEFGLREDQMAAEYGMEDPYGGALGGSVVGANRGGVVG